MYWMLSDEDVVPDGLRKGTIDEESTCKPEARLLA